jgi:outer membrane protein assembly factor BamB
MRTRAVTRWLGPGFLGLLLPSGLALALGPPGRAHAPITVPARSDASDHLPIPSSYGDWTQWRGNPQHTGFQSLPGRIDVPAVQWRYRLGGRVAQWQAVTCAGPSPSDRKLLIAPPGRLAAYSLDGDLLWERRNTLMLDLLGCWDFAGDGRTEILAASSGQSGGRLSLFDSQGGSLLWSSPAAPGGVGAVKVAHFNSATGLRLLWLPAASSRITAFALAPGQTEPETLWSRELADFVSDPYTHSSLAIGDLNDDGSQQVVISGGRHSIPTIVLDAASGGELFRQSITIDGHGVESGGTRQLLQLHDVTGDGRPEIVTISGYNGDEAYMFQGITVTGFTTPSVDALLDTFPVGLRYVKGSIQDFDGDGKAEILVSRYSPEAGRHTLLLLDASRLVLKAILPNFFLRAIISPNGGRDRVILCSRDVTSENNSGQEPLTAFRYDGSTFVETDWDSSLGMIAHVRRRAFDKTDEDNPGDEAILFNAPAAGTEAILLFGDRNRDGRPDELVAADVASGAAIERWGIAPGVPIELLATEAAPDPSRSRFVVAGGDGSLTLLDGAFHVVRTVAVGGYYRSDALNGHSFEVAAVADLDGSGRKDVLALDSLSRVVKLTGVADATPVKEPRGEVLWDSSVNQELVAVPAAGGGARLLVRGWKSGLPFLRMIDGAGGEVWNHSFAAPSDIPVGLNFGRFVDGSSVDVVASVASADGPRRTWVLDGRTGETVWNSGVGTYWDGSIAVGDADQDGLDDVVFNYNQWKGFVLKGLSGAPLSDAAILPAYQDLEIVDYNGAPIVLGSLGGSPFLFLDSGDDAHLAMLMVSAGSGIPDPVAAVESWSVEQASPDDERYSMAAVAPLGPDNFVVGVGSQKGSLKAVRGTDGSFLWKTELWNGAAASVSSVQPNSLSSVLAMDVNGDGRPDFVVGGADGWLYTVDAATGSLLWSLDLGASVGEPIAADIDGNGSSELLVSAADGYLYAIGPRSEDGRR